MSVRSWISLERLIAPRGSLGQILIQSQKGWEIRDGRIYFPQDDENKEVLQAGTIIENTVTYARELETIV